MTLKKFPSKIYIYFRDLKMIFDSNNITFITSILTKASFYVKKINNIP